MEFNVIELNTSYKPQLLKMLKAAGLITEDILEDRTRYWGAFIGDKLIGAIGCEYENCCGLLRSAIVLEQYRGKGVALRLTDTLIGAAEEEGLEAVYLFSPDAGEYWNRQGFSEVPVKELVDNIPGCRQVKLLDRLGLLPTELAYKYSLAQSSM